MTDYEHLSKAELIARLETLERANRRTDEAMRKSEARLRSILNTVVDGIILVDTRGIVRSFNPAAEHIFRYAADEIIGRDIALLMPSPHREKHDNYIQRYVTTHEARIIGSRREVQGQRKDGSVFPMDLAVTETWDGELFFTGIVRDITERKRLQAQIQQQQQELAHADRLSLAGEMATGLAHELNQPLTAITTHAHIAQQMLRSGDANLERCGKPLEKIIEQSKRASDIVRHLRRLIRKAEPIREPVNINKLIQEVVQLAEIESRRRGVLLQVEARPPLPPVRVNVLQIQQVLLNLIYNAIEAMAESQSNIKHLIISATAQDTAVEITVADTGPGLSTDNAEKLFQPFFTTKSSGTGLGLPICRTIIEAHRGRIWATANPAHGATFHLTLPAAQDDCDVLAQSRSP